MAEKTPGILYVIASPIGNLSDLSPRALATLHEVSDIYCEDTRQARKLLSAFEIQGKALHRCDRITEKSQTPGALEKLLMGQNIAYLSDAGTPGLADPVAYLTSQCHAHNVKVTGIPGPSCISLALSMSGFWSQPFTFHGFLDRKKARRLKELENILSISHAHVLLESPHRIVSTLEILASIDPHREVFVARELTKKFEEYFRGPSKKVHSEIAVRNPKGEYTVVISERSKGES
ncbi:MAG: 16S rRNA (cytidine(1402)-2'-O)-methyltransferase [Bdellovibrionota bacterium]